MKQKLKAPIEPDELVEQRKRAIENEYIIEAENYYWNEDERNPEERTRLLGYV